MTAPLIIPAILTSRFTDAISYANKLNNLVEYVHIDVMDGVFVPGKSFDPDEMAGFKSNLKWELHLMVEHPLLAMESWSNIKNIFRVIFHIESSDGIEQTINYARGKCWQVGIALNPDTSLEKVAPYLSQLNVVQFMTVYPGRQGSPFVPEVIGKIKQFTSLPNRPLCGVDGSVNKDTIQGLREAGVEIFCVGSALSKAEDVERECGELKTLIQN